MRLLLMFPSIIPAMSLPVGTLPRPPGDGGRGGGGRGKDFMSQGEPLKELPPSFNTFTSVRYIG